LRRCPASREFLLQHALHPPGRRGEGLVHPRRPSLPRAGHRARGPWPIFADFAQRASSSATSTGSSSPTGRPPRRGGPRVSAEEEMIARGGGPPRRVAHHAVLPAHDRAAQAPPTDRRGCQCAKHLDISLAASGRLARPRDRAQTPLEVTVPADSSHVTPRETPRISVVSDLMSNNLPVEISPCSPTPWPAAALLVCPKSNLRGMALALHIRTVEEANASDHGCFVRAGRHRAGRVKCWSPVTTRAVGEQRGGPGGVLRSRTLRGRGALHLQRRRRSSSRVVLVPTPSLRVAMERESRVRRRVAQTLARESVAC